MHTHIKLDAARGHISLWRLTIAPSSHHHAAASGQRAPEEEPEGTVTLGEPVSDSDLNDRFAC